MIVLSSRQGYSSTDTFFTSSFFSKTEDLLMMSSSSCGGMVSDSYVTYEGEDYLADSKVSIKPKSPILGSTTL